MPSESCKTSINEILGCAFDTTSEKLRWVVVAIAATFPAVHLNLETGLAVISGVSAIVLAWLNIYLVVLKIRVAKKLE